MLLGINDITAAGQLAHKLWTCGSSQYTSAYQEYRDFMRDVENVSNALLAIQNELKNFNSVTTSARSDISAQHLSALDLAISGVHDTLARSEKLLLNNPKFKWSQGYIVNIEWNFDIAERVKALQTRILFHCTKINLFIQPLQIYIQNCLRQMLTLLHEDVDDRLQHIITLLADISRSLRGSGYIVNEEIRTLPSLPTEIADRIYQASLSRAQVGVDGVREMFDAAIYHYEESTRSFVPVFPIMVRPTVKQYLNLLKCLWLLRRMRQDAFFDRFCNDSLSAAYVRQVERRVDAEFRRFEGQGALQAPELDEMLSEGSDSFEIWPDLGIIDTTPNLTDAQLFEVELFKVPLQRLARNRDRSLAVFRSGENYLRFVEVTTSTNIAGEREREYELNCQKAVLVPIYAHPQNQSSCSVSWKSSVDASRMNELAFQDRPALLQFQAAVTNFAVRADLGGLTSIRGKQSAHRFDGSRGTELGGEGHVQLWRYRRPPEADHNDRRESTTSGYMSSAGSSSGNTWSHDYIMGRNPNSTIRSNQTGSYLDPTVPSQLVIFTTHQNRLRLISITIDERTAIEPGLCDCCKPKKAAECTRFGIERSRGTVQVRVHDSEPDDANGDISKFNVALLRHPPHADVGRNVQHFSFKWVMLNFVTPAAREDLSQRLTIVQALVRQDVESYNRDLQNLRSPQIRPER